MSQSLSKDSLYAKHIPTIITSTLFYLLQTSPSQVKAAADLQALGTSYTEVKVITPAEVNQLFTHYMANVPLFEGVTIELATQQEESVTYAVIALYEQCNKQYIMPDDFFASLQHTEGAKHFATWLEQVVRLVIDVRVAVDGAIEEEQPMIVTEVAPVTNTGQAIQLLNTQMLRLYRVSDEAQRQAIKQLRADLFEIEFAVEEDGEWQGMLLGFQNELLALELEEVSALKAQIAMLRIVTTLLQQ